MKKRSINVFSQPIQKIDNCLACGSDNLMPVLDLNTQPLANSYKKGKYAAEESYPLAINVCKNCHHVQLTHMVDPDLMYKDYLYVSGTTKTYLDYMDWFGPFCREKHGDPKSVLDIGCNDGSQLNVFKSMGLDTYGVDPAVNLYPLSSENHNVCCGYFDDNYKQKVDLIISQNSFAHNQNPLEFLLNSKNNLNPNGLIFIQTSQSNMITHNEFDTIYHEHISFYNIKSMKMLCNRAGLNLIDVVKTPIHGISYVFIISADREAPYTIDNLIAMETVSGLYNDVTYQEYSETCLKSVEKSKNYIDSMKKNGAIIVGYGAPAKGNTFLNFSKIRMDFIVDDNKLKQGMFTPGSSIPIVSSDDIKNLNPDVFVVFVPLAWNFFKEIKQRIKAIRNNPNDVFLNLNDI